VSAWGEHLKRGVFKTTELVREKVWKKILFTNNKSGVGDLGHGILQTNKLCRYVGA